MQTIREAAVRRSISRPRCSTALVSALVSVSFVQGCNPSDQVAAASRSVRQERVRDSSFACANGACASSAGAYRIRAGAAGITVVARTGSQSPDRSIDLAPSEIRTGGERTTLSAPPAANGAGRLVIDGGWVHEEDSLDASGFEQTWRFDRKPREEDDLVVRVRFRGASIVERAAGLDLRVGPTAAFRYSAATWIDASGDRTEIPVRVVDGWATMRVPASVVRASEFPTRLDPLLSAEFEADAPITIDRLADAAAVASDGVGYLAVWVTHNDGLRTMLLDASGTPAWAGSAFLSADADWVQDPTPSIAWNGTNYLVAWTPTASGNAVGVRFARDGSMIDGAPFVIGRGWEGALATNGADYLFVSGGTNLNAYRISDTGMVRDATPIAVSTTAGDDRRPSVAWNGTEYLIAWEKRGTGVLDVLASRVDASGSVLDSAPIRIAAGTNQEFAPSVAAGGGMFLVGWATSVDPFSNPVEIRVARVDSSGTVVDPSGILVATVGANSSPSLGVAWDGSNFVVTWTDLTRVLGAHVSPAGSLVETSPFVIRSGGWTVYDAGISSGAQPFVWWIDNPTPATPRLRGTRFEGTGASPPDGRVLSQTANPEISPSVAWNGTEYLVAWNDSRNGQPDIFAARWSPTGQMLDAVAIPLATGAAYQHSPSVASDGTGFLVTWDEGTSGSVPRSVYARRVGADGVPLDSTPITVVNGGTSGYNGFPAVAWNGAHYVVAWNGGNSVAARRISAAGTLLDSFAIVMSGGSSSSGASIASDGTNTLIGWWTFGTFGNTTYAGRLSRAGTRLDPTGIVLDGSGSTYGPSLAFDGTNYLAVWNDGTSHANSATRISAAGVVLDSPRILVSSGSNAARVAWNGMNYLVAWTTSSGDQNILGARMSSTGAILTSTPLTLVASPLADSDIALASDGSGSTLLASVRTVFEQPYGTVRVRARFVGQPDDLGVACTTGVDCRSGSCVDGVCCDTACGGGATDCQACSVAAGGAVDGTCGPVASGRACGVLAGNCDVQEFCDGVATSCPADVVLAAGTPCRAAAGVCDNAESCDGVSGRCPVDAFMAGIECRAAADRCDAAEQCGGTSPDCPPDALLPSGSECRASTGRCDTAEQCTGTSIVCPPDVAAVDGADCSDGLSCNGSESCHGGVCTAGAPLVCNDMNDCTADSCGEPGGCRFEPIANCCTTASQCADSDPCTIDDCAGSRCTHSADPACSRDAGADAAPDVNASDASDAGADAVVGDIGAESPGVAPRSGCACSVPTGRNNSRDGAALMAFVALAVAERRTRRARFRGR